MKKLAFSIFAAAMTFGANAAEDVEATVAAEQTCCGYNGFYMGLGIAAIDSGVKTETTDAYAVNGAGVYGRWAGGEGVDSNDHSTRFYGTLALGYGRTLKEKAYLALEAGLDAGQSSNFFHAGMLSTSNRQFEVSSRQNGLIPSIGLKLGYVDPASKGMVYLKAGVAYAQAKTHYEEYVPDNAGNNNDVIYDGKCSKWAPFIALGGEKLCGKNVRTRLEVEYRFNANKSFNYDQALLDGTRYNGTVKLTSKDAITLRAMAIYTVRS